VKFNFWDSPPVRRRFFNFAESSPRSSPPLLAAKLASVRRQFAAVALQKIDVFESFWNRRHFAGTTFFFAATSPF